MRSFAAATVFFAFLVLPAFAFAHQVQIDTNGFEGSWWLDGTRHVGDQTVDLVEGNHQLRPGWQARFDFEVDANGVVSSSTHPHAATMGAHSLTFNTIPVTVDPGLYQGSYIGAGIDRSTSGPTTLHLIPGIGGNYQLGFDFAVGHAEVRYDLEADGAVVPFDETKAHNWWSATTINGGQASISFNTTPVTIDPDNYGGSMRLMYAANPRFSNGSFYGAQTFDLPVGIDLALRFIGDHFVFSIHADGTVSVPSADSATTSGNVLTLRNTVTTFDAGLYQGHYSVNSRVDGVYWRFGDHDLVMVPGLRHSIRLTELFTFTLDANGDVVAVSEPASFTGDGTTLRFNTVPVVVDPENYSGGWGLWNGSNGFEFVEGRQVVDLVPVADYRVRFTGPYVPFHVDAAGDVSTVNSLGDVAFTTTANEVQFNTVQVRVDPGDWAHEWYALGKGGTTHGSKTWTGVQDLWFVPGVDYRFSVAGQGSDLAAIYDPCAVQPEVLVLSSTVSLAFSCDVAPPDADDDGIPDESDNCPQTANPDQVDLDQDGAGDACDADDDGDGVDDSTDNCPTTANADQTDTDGDGLGDLCDEDADGDLVVDAEDNCPFVANTDQADNDQDGAGDECDDDDDDDGVLDWDDNCVFTANADQSDADGDGNGDACDADVDGDGVANEDDLCADTPAGSPVSAEGCTGSQFVALRCDPASFANHGRYVSCVAHAAADAVDLELLSEREKGRFVRDAARNR